jgi:phosphatidylserine/phosphatidylglycerophosphate/cardiolipin synthase-like enzyme
MRPWVVYTEDDCCDACGCSETRFCRYTERVAGVRQLLERVEQATDPFDAAFGNWLEARICNHHRRRLRRLGKGYVLDPPPGLWLAGDPPPREGNRVEILIDGEEALARLQDDLLAARSHVHLTGWFFSPEFRLTADGPPLRDLLADVARRAEVRVLAWAGSPLPLFRPWAPEVRRAREALTAGTGVRMELDTYNRPMHCHHEKTAVIDDRVAYVGGIDLTSFAGNRLDAQGHPPRPGLGWHDAAARLEGPAVADVARHFRLRWQEEAHEPLPAPVAPEPAGDVAVQVARTVRERRYQPLPRGDFRILEAYARALRAAERLVHLESQFLWSPEIVAILRRKLERPPHPDFRLVILLPANPNNGADDTHGQLGELAAADAPPHRMLACTLFQADPPQNPVYVHAKIGIVDDRWLTIGSANLNEHSLFNDTEVNLVVCDERVARETRLRLWSEHLGLPLEEVAGDPAEVIDRLWRPVAEEQRRRLDAGEPLTRSLALLPGVSHRAKRLIGPLQSFVVDG